VTHIYGFPGDGISSTLKALGKAMDRFTFVQARHEEEAAFMACAQSLKHEVGCGPGHICLLPLEDAPIANRVPRPLFREKPALRSAWASGLEELARPPVLWRSKLRGQ
jgi:hypothetical protein